MDTQYIRHEPNEQYRAIVGRAVDRASTQLRLDAARLTVRIVRAIGDDGELGVYEHGTDCVTVFVYGDTTRNDVIETIRHELYHVWQYRNGQPMDENTAETFATML